MLRLFEVCFYTGAAYTVISFLLGQLLHFADWGSHFHVDGGADMHGDFHGDMPGVAVSPLKPITIASFLTVFGGVGIISIRSGFGMWIAALIGLGAGFLVSFLLYRFIVVPLYNAQSTSAISQKALIGGLAKTTLSITNESFGRISYTVNGNTYSAPAKSADGKDIEKGVPVVIIDINKNTFLVKQIRGGM